MEEPWYTFTEKQKNKGPMGHGSHVPPPKNLTRAVVSYPQLKQAVPWYSLVVLSAEEHTLSHLYLINFLSVSSPASQEHTESIRTSI